MYERNLAAHYDKLMRERKFHLSRVDKRYNGLSFKQISYCDSIRNGASEKEADTLYIDKDRLAENKRQFLALGILGYDSQGVLCYVKDGVPAEVLRCFSFELKKKG